MRTVEIEGRTYVYLATQAELDAYLPTAKEDAGADFVGPVKLYGPGWYRFWRDRRRCPKGCCYDLWLEAATLEADVEDAEAAADNAVRLARALTQLNAGETP